MSVLDGVELAFVTGKGGVGKTTVALATALAAAARRPARRAVRGRRAGARRAPLRRRRLRGPGARSSSRTDCGRSTIDPVVALEEWAGRQIGSRRLVGLLTHSNAFAAFVERRAGRARAGGHHQGVGARPARALGQGPGPATTSSSSTRPPAATASACCARPHTFAEIARVGPIASQARRVVDAAGGPGAQRAHGRRAAGRAVDQRDARARGARRRAPSGARSTPSSSTASCRGASAPRRSSG